jgi:hypothetical protein
VHNRKILGQNSNTSLPLLIITVHNSPTGLIRLLLIPKHSRLLNHTIHEGGLSVIDVSNDGNVTDFGIGYL